ncbi:hypothetical protein Afil01_07450 [Actinorhabdospora filicis]|uniref:Uncharacterized protein n=1 Tax=Actinorhabdospora filicis TaxID=1785913 RepID=A0A9W6W7H3_9ACTN|nr:hypothetical protein [Actinorhabdospora filicis]GLZ75938.1 hypothetical protein Afil01_07450 [Actinorhabdospora filicis]
MKRPPALPLALWTALGLAPLLAVLAVHAVHPLGWIGTATAACAIAGLGAVLALGRRGSWRTGWTWVAAGVLGVLGVAGVGATAVLEDSATRVDLPRSGYVRVLSCQPAETWRPVWTCEVADLFETFEVTGAVTPWDIGHERLLEYDADRGRARAGDYSPQLARTGLGVLSGAAIIAALVLLALAWPKPDPTRLPERAASIPEDAIDLGAAPAVGLGPLLGAGALFTFLMVAIQYASAREWTGGKILAVGLVLLGLPLLLDYLIGRWQAVRAGHRRMWLHGSRLYLQRRRGVDVAELHHPDVGPGPFAPDKELAMVVRVPGRASRMPFPFGWRMTQHLPVLAAALQGSPHEGGRNVAARILRIGHTRASAVPGPSVHVERRPDVRRGVFGLAFGIAAMILLVSVIALFTRSDTGLVPFLAFFYAVTARTAFRWAAGAYSPAVVDESTPVAAPPAPPPAAREVTGDAVALDGFPYGPAAAEEHRELTRRRNFRLTLWAVLGLPPLLAAPFYTPSLPWLVAPVGIGTLAWLLGATIPIGTRRKKLDIAAWGTAGDLVLRKGRTVRVIPLRHGVVDIRVGSLIETGTEHALPLTGRGEVRTIADLDILRSTLASSPYPSDREAADLLPAGRGEDPGRAPEDPPALPPRPAPLPAPDRPRPEGVPGDATPLTTLHGEDFPKTITEQLPREFSFAILFTVIGLIALFVVPPLAGAMAGPIAIAALGAPFRIARARRLSRDCSNAWISGHWMYLAGPTGVKITSLHDPGIAASGDLTVTVPVDRRAFKLIIATGEDRRADAEIRALAAALSESPHADARTAARRVLALVPAGDSGE